MLKKVLLSTLMSVILAGGTTAAFADISTHSNVGAQNSSADTSNPSFTIGLNVLPPDGFNPATASDNELAKYGIPKKPSDSATLKKWMLMYGNIRHWIIPQTERSTNPATRTATLGSCFDTNWSGISLDNAGSDTYNYVQATFTIPQLSSYSPVATNYVDYWVGLGGSNPEGVPVPSLWQDGVESYITTSGTTSYRAWWTDINMNYYPVYINNLTVRPGDEISVFVQHVTSNGDYMEYMVNNESTSTSSGWISDNTNGRFGTAGNIAEVITEDPGSETYVANPLAKYQSQTYSNFGVEDVYGYLYNTSGGTGVSYVWQYVLQNYSITPNYSSPVPQNTSDYMSEPTSFNGGLVTTLWEHYY